MNRNNISIQITDWDKIPAIKHKRETAMALWRTLQLGDLRIRMVEYSKKYQAECWSEKGHIIFFIEREMNTELADGQKFKMTKEMSYQVYDDLSSHCTYYTDGVKLFIIDGTF